MDVVGRLDRPIEFLAVGHLAVDYRQGRRILGGAAAYSCVVASRLGLVAAMVTAVGRDFDLFEALQGVEIHYHREGVSTSFENVYDKATRRQRLLGRARHLRQDDLGALAPRLAEDAAVLYCPIAGEVTFPLEHPKGGGLCGVAPQGFFRRWDEDGTVRATAWVNAREQLKAVDFVSTSANDPPEAEAFRRTVIDRVPVLVITEGERGARVFINGRGYHVPAFPRRAVDPTGAGDVFAASAIVALREGQKPLEAVQFASCAASFAVEREGIEGMPPNRRSVLERLSIYQERFQPTVIDS
jgi:1D-myo-inositol 3-kinase